MNTSLETFAEIQYRRVKGIAINETRRRQLRVRSFEIADVGAMPVPTWKTAKGTSADPIRAAYRQLGIVYE